MKKIEKSLVKPNPISDNLFDRVVSILEQARVNVVRSVNSQMVIAYWSIGREIVQDLQSGKERAEYGRRLIDDLSKRLTARYGKGFSTTNLWYFRQFYTSFKNRSSEILHPMGGESKVIGKLHPMGSELDVVEKRYPAGSESLAGFHPNLTWSHYRALMRVEDEKTRDFYETEAVRCSWDKRVLERQIATLFYERLLKSGNKSGMLKKVASESERLEPVNVLKDPYILEFLNLPDTPELHESKLEEALIANLQKFLLELGRGFSFVARQKHIRIGSKDFFVDLVFYNYLLKCFLLIDLKVGDLTHQDIGQMDGYVRLFEEQFRAPDDNPTIGLILCSDKDDAIVHYSVLKENKKLFASRYKLVLPGEDDLRKEIERERRLIENAGRLTSKRKKLTS
jgi:predicted nuclease of restriction endonuclease-like (RecB) superfamily